MKHRIVAGLFLLLSLASATTAQPLADRAPADSLAYLSFKGSAHLGPAYDQSHLKAVLAASNFGQLYRELLPQLLEKAVQNDPDGARKLADALTALEILGRQGFSLAILPLQADRAPGFFLSCDAGPEADALEKLARSLLADDPDFALSRDATLLTLRRSDAAPAPGLAAAPAFTSALAQVHPDPVLLAYVDFHRILAAIDVLDASSPPGERVWPKVKEAAGLAGLKRYVYTGAFDGPNWSTRSFVDAPEPRTGWLALARGQALPASLLARVPADATYVRAGHFDPVGWLKNFRQIAASVGGPKGQQQFDQILGATQMYIGANVMTDLLGPLGTDWAVYSAPSLATPDAPYNLLLVNKVASEAKARSALTSVTYALANTSQNPRVRQNGFAARADQRDINGIKVTFLKLASPPPQFANLSLAWAIKDGHLFLGLSPDSVAAAANYAGQAFADSPRVTETLKLVAAPAPHTSFEYATILPEQYQTLRTMTDAYLAMAQANGLKATVNPLPTADALAPHLGPVLRVSWSDPAGLHSRSTAPFPGAPLLTPSGLSSVGVASLGVSIVLPSLNRARETANRVQCAGNMKQIWTAVRAYADANDGRYPPDLATLLAAGSIEPEQLVCRSSDDSVPSTKALRQKADASEQPGHVARHTDYVYVGHDLTTAADPDTLVLYEKLEDHDRDGMNMLFANGYVQFYLPAEAERIISDRKRNATDR